MPIGVSVKKQTGTVSIDGVLLPINPESLEWDYSVRIATAKTIGGKVVQLLGWNMGDLVVTGKFGRGGPERQEYIFKHLNSIAMRQNPQYGEAPSRPVRFLWPEMGWDFWVFLKKFTQTGANVSIERNQRIHSPGYTLTMFVYEDNGDIVKAVGSSAAVAYLKRLSAGLGWKQTEWNGPETIEDLQTTLQGQTIMDYAFSWYGLTGPSINPNPAQQVGTVNPNLS